MELSESEREITRLHTRGADDNLSFGDWLKTTSRNDYLTIGWVITALFYAAVHEVRAYLIAVKRERVSNHDDVKEMRHKYPELNRTHRDYESLKQQSQSARYYLNASFTWKDYDSLRATCLRIRSHWRPLTQRALGNPSDGAAGG